MHGLLPAASIALLAASCSLEVDITHGFSTTFHAEADRVRDVARTALAAYDLTPSAVHTANSSEFGFTTSEFDVTTLVYVVDDSEIRVTIRAESPRASEVSVQVKQSWVVSREILEAIRESAELAGIGSRPVDYPTFEPSEPNPLVQALRARRDD